MKIGRPVSDKQKTTTYYFLIDDVILDPPPPRSHLEFGENVEKVFADEQIPIFEQIRLQFESTYDAHR